MVTSTLASNTNEQLNTSQNSNPFPTGLPTSSSSHNNTSPIVLNLQSKINEQNTIDQTQNINLNNNDGHETSMDTTLLPLSNLCDKHRQFQNKDISTETNFK